MANDGMRAKPASGFEVFRHKGFGQGIARCEFLRGSGRNECRTYTVRRADWCEPCKRLEASRRG